MPYGFREHLISCELRDMGNRSAPKNYELLPAISAAITTEMLEDILLPRGVSDNQAPQTAESRRLIAGRCDLRSSSPLDLRPGSILAQPCRASTSSCAKLRHLRLTGEIT